MSEPIVMFFFLVLASTVVIVTTLALAWRLLRRKRGWREHPALPAVWAASIAVYAVVRIATAAAY